MAQTLKKIAFLVPKPGLTRAEFTEHWRTVHGPLVASSPGYAEYRQGYAQNHAVADTAIGRPFPWAGIAEFWLPGDASNEEQFAETSIYRDRIAPDERNFIDMDATVSMTAVETVARPGRGPAKAIMVCKTSSHSKANDIARQVLADPAAAQVAGWVINSVVPGSFRAPGARAVDDLRVEAVHELWFRSVGDATEFTTSIGGDSYPYFHADLTYSFIAEESVFFQDGKFVKPGRGGA